MNLYTRILPWGTAAGSATEYAAATRREVLEWLVGACPLTHCNGPRDCAGTERGCHACQPGLGCPACDGTGLDLTELVETIKSTIGETFVREMGWGESEPWKALEVYAIAQKQSRAVVAELLRVLGGET